MPPELQKQLDEQTELIIDDWIEQKHAHEIVKPEYLEGTCQACEASDLVKGICSECGADNDGPV